MTQPEPCAWCGRTLEHRDVGIKWEGRRYCSRTCSERHRQEMARVEWLVIGGRLGD